MSVRIPKYEQQIGTPNTRVTGGEGGRAFQSYRLDTSGIASFAEHMAGARRQTAINDTNAAIAAEELRAQLTLETEFARLSREWMPGSPSIGDEMNKAIDAVRTDAETRITDPRGRELVAERANQFRVQYGLRGFAYEQKASLDARVTTFENAYSDAASFTSTNPAQFGEEIARINALVQADTQFPEAAKAEFVREKSHAAALQVAKSQSELNPRAAADIAGALLGVTEPTIPGKTAVDIAEEIVRRESGGRMYGEDGGVIRGPAIRTAGGQTIHAYGPYQMLETTAEAQARALDIPWQPEVFHRARTGDAVQDAETRAYHDLLGQGFIEQQREEFGGNPVLIAAAHNMGPEATKGWAAGRPFQTQSGKWWYPRTPMDMSALPEETRRYVQDLGAVEEPVATADATGSEAATAFRLLNTDDLIAVRGAAMSNLAEEQRQRAAAMAVERDLFRQRVQDIETAAKHGDAIELPSDGELVTFLGPAQAMLTKQRLATYQGLAKGLKGMPALSNDELRSVAYAPDPEGTDNRENRQFVRDAMATEAARVLAARVADPGQAATDTSDVVSQAYLAYGTRASEFYAAGGSATPEQFDAMAQAQAEFVSKSFAQQRSWGVTQPKLPTAVVDRMAEGFRVQLERDPVQAAAYVERLPDLLGSDDAVAQVGEKMGPVGWLAMDGVPGVTLAKLQATRALPEGKRGELLPEGTSKTDIERNVRQAFDPLFRTLAYQHDGVTAERYREAGVMLAMEKMSRTGGSAKEAAQSAYAELFTDRNAVNGTYRVDTRKHDPAAIEQRLAQKLATMPPAALLVAPEPGFTMEESQERALRSMRSRSFWVNNEAGTGVYLMHSTGPVIDAQGKPIAVSFDELMAAPATQVQPAAASSFRAAKGF